MEFERAIYRVYERSIEGFSQDEGIQDENAPFYKKSCLIFELLLLFCGFLFLSCLIYLHITFVGQPGCLPSHLMVLNETTNISSLMQFRADQIIGININEEYIRLELEAETDDLTNHENQKLLSAPLLGSSSLYSPKQTLGIPIFDFFHSPLSNFSQTNISSINSSSSSSISSTLGYDYLVTFDEGLILMKPEMIDSHHFEVINVTLGGKECFGGKTAESLLPIGGIDVAILNNVMFTVNRDAYMKSRFGDLFYWDTRDTLTSWVGIDWIKRKLNILLLSLLAFTFLTTTTAMLVRVLISSGVILVFPLFWFIQTVASVNINMRIVTISYPWIGLPMQLIRLRNQSTTPFIIAHLSRVIIYYIMYIGTQNMFIKWFYRNNSLGQQQLWLYAVMMLWEYYSMLYVRATGSIVLFPRASLALFLLFHFYYYSYPAGFHLLALLVMFCFLLFLKVYCIRKFEIKAYQQGLVSLDQPRMLYNALPWPSWRADLAPDYTLFMPVTTEATTVYQNTIPPLHQNEQIITNQTQNPLQASDTQNNPSETLRSNNNTESERSQTQTNSNLQPSPPQSESSFSLNLPLSFFSQFFNGPNYHSISSNNSQRMSYQTNTSSPTMPSNPIYDRLQSESTHGIELPNNTIREDNDEEYLNSNERDSNV